MKDSESQSVMTIETHCAVELDQQSLNGVELLDFARRGKSIHAVEEEVVGRFVGTLGMARYLNRR